MASLREIRRKIKSIKSTQQITKAMKMVAAARLRRAQQRIISARPFAQKMEEMIDDLLPRLELDEDLPYFRKRAAGKRILLLVTSDKGLCGAFNTNLIRQTLQYLRKYGAENVEFYVVGRKGRDYFRRLRTTIVKDYLGIFNNLNFVHAEVIAQDLIEAFASRPVTEVDVIYNEFRSVIQQKVIVDRLLPLASPEGTPKKPSNTLYEPSQARLIRGLLPRFVKAKIFRILLESSAAELGARMTAMDNATRNARDLLQMLTLRHNRTRQASITKEILEVVSGAEALK